MGEGVGPPEASLTVASIYISYLPLDYFERDLFWPSWPYSNENSPLPAHHRCICDPVYSVDPQPLHVGG